MVSPSKPSKKKRKVTTVHMNASKAKQASVLSPVTTSASPNRSSRTRRSSLSPSLKSKTAAISHPSSSKIHPPLSNTSFFSSIRIYSKDGTDMLSEISKNILNDFDLKYQKKQSNIAEKRSIRLINNHDNNDNNKIVQQVCSTHSPSLQNKHTLLSSYRRCLVEDFMVLPKDTQVIVLIPFNPKCSLLDSDSFWSSIDNNLFMNYQSIIQFKKSNTTVSLHL